MATRKADIIFVIDTSGSMMSCIQSVCQRLEHLVNGLQGDANEQWDVRLDFLAVGVQQFQSLHHRNGPYALLDALYGGQGQFFTRNLEEVRQGLRWVAEHCDGGDELTLVGLDTALDFPWREDVDARRGIILLSDESIMTGFAPAFERTRVDDSTLLEKIEDLGVNLFLVTPECPIYQVLGTVKGAIWRRDDTDDLSAVNWSDFLNMVGATISKSRLQAVRKQVPRAIYGQDDFRRLLRNAKNT